MVCIKLMLISGPPGLGKTTLAHIVARQAGYEVMEINARHTFIPIVIAVNLIIIPVMLVLLKSLQTGFGQYWNRAQH